MADHSAQKTATVECPLVERMVTFFADLSDEHYEEKRHSWISLLADEFPEFDPETRWNFRIGNKPGTDTPFIQGGAPQIEILDWCRDQSKQHATRVVRSFPSSEGQKGGVSFHVLPGDNFSNYQHYSDLLAFAKKWLPVWCDHFGVKSLDCMALHYVNKINADTTPSLVTKHKGIKIKNILKLFGGLDIPYDSLTTPYECKMGVILSKSENQTGRIEITGDQNRAGIKVEFNVKKTFTADTPVLLSFEEDLAHAHDRLIDLFTATFTPEAQAKFIHP